VGLHVFLSFLSSFLAVLCGLQTKIRGSHFSELLGIPSLSQLTLIVIILSLHETNPRMSWTSADEDIFKARIQYSKGLGMRKSQATSGSEKERGGFCPEGFRANEDVWSEGRCLGK
jgi:hypothetical protein